MREVFSVLIEPDDGKSGWLMDKDRLGVRGIGPQILRALFQSRAEANEAILGFPGSIAYYDVVPFFIDDDASDESA
jgi:hypothetical protein